MLDAALTYDGSVGAIDTLSMPHLAGETVEVVGDGIWLGSFDVGGDGSIPLGQEVTTAVAGKPFEAWGTLLPFEGGGDNGPAQGKMKRISRVALRLQDSLGVAVFDQTGRETDIEGTFPGTDLTEAIPLITRDVPIDLVSDWDRPGQLGWRRKAPFPSRVMALMAIGETSQR